MSGELEAGIVGLPNAGKSTLFNALTASGVSAEAYPFTTIEPNIGVVEVPDERLDRLFELLDVPRKVPAIVRFVDIAGLVEGAHRGEGLGNQFLAQIREVDAIVHVVRCFEDAEVAHPAGSVDPARDVKTVETELLLADLETVRSRSERVARAAHSGDQEARGELEFLERLEERLGEGVPARRIEADESEQRILRSLFLLTAKPVLYVANVSETGLEGGDPAVATLEDAVPDDNVIVLCADLEAGLPSLGPQEQREYLSTLGMEVPGVNRLIRTAFDVLGLITFFTFNEKEVRAWPIARGTNAVRAAGAVHSDFEEGFVRAETIGYADFISVESMKAGRDQGLVRAEGSDYVVQDGDILLFRAQT